jgi:hypothetical protein
LDGIFYHCFGDSWKPQISVDFLYNVKEVMRLARMDAHESRLSWKLIFHSKYFIWYAVDGLASLHRKRLSDGGRNVFFIADMKDSCQERWGVPTQLDGRGVLSLRSHYILLHIKKPITVVIHTGGK